MESGRRVISRKVTLESRPVYNGYLPHDNGSYAGYVPCTSRFELSLVKSIKQVTVVPLYSKSIFSNVSRPIPKFSSKVAVILLMLRISS